MLFKIVISILNNNNFDQEFVLKDLFCNSGPVETRSSYLVQTPYNWVEFLTTKGIKVGYYDSYTLINFIRLFN